MQTNSTSTYSFTLLERKGRNENWVRFIRKQNEAFYVTIENEGQK